MAGLTGCANGSVPVDIKFYGSFQATIDGTAYKLEYRLYRPDDEKTHPLIVMTHGRNGLYPQRYPSDVDGYTELCSALSRRGYVVMMLVRRGYGNSEGPDTEIKKTPFATGLESAKDVLSAVEYMKTQSYVEPKKIAVMGQSQGGWAVIAFSTLQVDGVLGSVNISGGANYADIYSDTLDVRYSKWIADCGEYGKINKIPTLWVYSPNDHSIPEFASQPMFTSFKDNGGKGKFVMKPSYSDNGHFFVSNPDFFMSDLLSFFDEIGLE